MRVGNLGGRFVLLTEDGAVDVAAATNGRLPADPAEAYDRWDEVVTWATALDPADLGPVVTKEVDLHTVGAPSPRPRQVFALALNYADHAGEVGAAAPAAPSVFTKFATSLTGPSGAIALPSEAVDWEVELVVVIGRPARHVAAADAWAHVAGVTVGQDLSERAVQFADATPQFSLAKSFPGFSPTGPWLVTPDELADPDDLALGCAVNGETVQSARTSEMVFPVPAIVAHLSSVLTLLPGDLIFTGTPAGVGALRHPPRFLAPGDELTTWVTGVGEMAHRLVAP
jgi:2-keto-4-pentenoate hydratase/2-oxohepta-3-ene-1,7-dioic acid hydratase in catechol pathway